MKNMSALFQQSIRIADHFLSAITLDALFYFFTLYITNFTLEVTFISYSYAFYLSDKFATKEIINEIA